MLKLYKFLIGFLNNHLCGRLEYFDVEFYRFFVLELDRFRFSQLFHQSICSIV